MTVNQHKLLFMLLLLLITLGLAASAFAQVVPSQDAYTNTAAPNTNYGAATTLGAVSSATSIQTTYIQFNLGSVPSGYTGNNVAKATLKLFVASVSKAGSFNVDYVNGIWSESTITNGLAPALGGAIASSVPLTTANVNDYVLVDVTPAVQAWLNGSQVNDGIAIVPNSPLSATFDSKENTTLSHHAELDIVYTSGGTITGVTTSSSSGLTGGGTTGTLSLALQSCATNQVLQYNGSKWVCASTGTGTITGVTAGTDLTGGGSTGNITLNLDTTKVPLLNSANSFVGTQTFSGFAKNMIVGDPGCGPGFVGIGFGALSGCSNYSMIGDGTNTYLNRPTGGLMLFREGNNNTMAIFPGGAVTMDLYSSPTFASALTVTSYSETSDGLQVTGGGGGTEFADGGRGILAIGGTETNTDSGFGGDGIDVYGGGASAQGGQGIYTQGGASTSSVGGDGIDAYAGNGYTAQGYAGYFNGNVSVYGNIGASGSVTGSVKNFRIDHPLDPANKYLYHASVESSEMMNIYSGNAILDASGSATIRLPEWFEALNTDFRYQLTAIGASAPGLYVAQEVANHQFAIAGGAPGVKVSWQVTAVRHDAYAAAHPMTAEQDKAASERGFYQNPELFGQPREKQLEWGRAPQKMRRLQQMHDHSLHPAAKK